MENRLAGISEPSKSTQDWLWEENEGPKLVEWLRRGRGIYWILGKPASGKSTAMKNIALNSKTLENLQQDCGSTEKWIIANAFFHGRGGRTQSSLYGILCHLLHQILSKERALVPIVKQFGSHDILKLDNEKEPSFSWTTDSLKRALFAVATQDKVPLNICLLVDALDEHTPSSDIEHREMIMFFNTLVRYAQDSTETEVVMKMIVSSRPEPALERQMLSTQGFRMQDWTTTDIIRYVDTRLSETLDSSSTGAQHHFVQWISHRADGVFLWVELVVDRFLNSWDAGIQAPWRLELELRLIPKDLRSLYHEILQSIKPSDQVECYLMIQLVLCAKKPLRLLQLTFMVDLAIAQKFEQPQNSTIDLFREPLSRLNRCEIMKKRIQTCCKGLLEVVGESIQIIHETAREFLQKPEALDPLSHGRARQSLGGHTHALKFWFQWLSIDSSARLDLGFNLSTDSSWEVGEEILYHAPLAESIDGDHAIEIITGILEKLPEAPVEMHYFPELVPNFKGLNLDNSKPLRDTTDERLRGYGELVHIPFLAYAVAKDMLRYVRSQVTRDAQLLNDYTGWPLLYFAAIFGHSKMVDLLLDNGASVHWKCAGPDHICQGVRYIDAEISDIFYHSEPTQALMFQDCDRNGEPQKTIIKSLLEAGANPEILIYQSGQHYLPTFLPLIHKVAQMPMRCSCKLDLWKTLYEHGASLTSRDRDGNTLLHWVLESEKCKDVTLEAATWLMNHGARFDEAMVRSGVIYQPRNIFSHPSFRKTDFYQAPALMEAQRSNNAPQWGGQEVAFSLAKKSIKHFRNKLNPFPHRSRGTSPVPSTFTNYTT